METKTVIKVTEDLPFPKLMISSQSASAALWVNDQKGFILVAGVASSAVGTDLTHEQLINFKDFPDTVVLSN